MIAERSTSVNRTFGVLRTLRLLGRSRSSIYWARSRCGGSLGHGRKRGLKTAYSDAELTEHVRAQRTLGPRIHDGTIMAANSSALTFRPR